MENSRLPQSPDARAVAERIVGCLLSHKAVAVTLFSVADVTTVTEYYVNATGRSSTQVRSLCDDVTDALAEEGIRPLHVEGRDGGAWLLADYGYVIVNIFDRESRAFYDLDRRFPPECKCDISGIVAEVDRKFGAVTPENG